MTIRVLIAEDSPTVRALLADVVASDPQLELVAIAEDGRQAIEMCAQFRPDIVTMDMVMPVMTGLAATEHIMAYFPTPILVVSSSFNRGELFKMYDALVAGAVDVLEKPTGDEPAGVWEQRFLATVKLVSRIKVVTHLRPRTAAARPAHDTDTPRLAPISLIAIGASTGGPGAIVELLGSLPTRIDVPVLFVMHINPQFGHAFADWLDAQTQWRVRFASDGEPLPDRGGTVLMAPANRHLVLRQERLRLDDGPERFSCKPSVDVLFESLASERGAQTVAVLLTGMGRDGANGLLAIRTAGGSTIAQDEATSVVYGMPREAKLNGGAQRILPLPAIAPALVSTLEAANGR